MPGKATWGHWAREAGWVQDCKITAEEWRDIEAALGRTRRLDDDERAQVSEVVSLHAEFHRSRKEDIPSTRDVKAMLRALAKLMPDDLWRVRVGDGAHFDRA